MNLLERLVAALEKQNELYQEFIQVTKKSEVVEEPVVLKADVETFAEVQVEEVPQPEIHEDTIPFEIEPPKQPMTRRELQDLVIANYDNTVGDKEFVNQALAKAGVRRATELQENGDCELVWEEYKRLKGLDK